MWCGGTSQSLISFRVRAELDSHFLFEEFDVLLPWSPGKDSSFWSLRRVRTNSLGLPVRHFPCYLGGVWFCLLNYVWLELCTELFILHWLLHFLNCRIKCRWGCSALLLASHLRNEWLASIPSLFVPVRYFLCLTSHIHSFSWSVVCRFGVDDFELTSEQKSVQFSELFLTIELVQSFDFTFPGPVKFIIFGIGEQPTSSLGPWIPVPTYGALPGAGPCGGCAVEVVQQAPPCVPTE